MINLRDSTNAIQRQPQHQLPIRRRRRRRRLVPKSAQPTPFFVRRHFIGRHLIARQLNGDSFTGRHLTGATIKRSDR